MITANHDRHVSGRLEAALQANDASRSAERAHPGMVAFPAGAEAGVEAHAP
jgi:hypothetical protein